MAVPDDLAPISEKPFSEALECFEKLLTQSGRSFLLGAGCSKCAGLPSTTELTDQCLANDQLCGTTKSLLSAIRQHFETCKDVNIEDYLSELIDQLAIVERRENRGATSPVVTIGTEKYNAEQLRKAVSQIKNCISTSINIQVSIDVHRKFIESVHRPLRQGKYRLGDTVDYLVLNYDTLLEDALALHQIAYADGLDGGATGWWNPSSFDRPGLFARVLKLHGSIDWCELKGDPLPRRISPCLRTSSTEVKNILIWPASTKYRETQLDPYAQLIARARRVLRPGHDAQRVLVISGYRFADSHINLELDTALRETTGELTIVAFTENDEPVGQLKAWHDDSAVSNRVLVFCKRGFFHGEIVSKSPVELPWWKFENMVRIIGGER